MPIGAVNFTKANGGLGLAPQGKDHYTALVFLTNGVSPLAPATYSAGAHLVGDIVVEAGNYYKAPQGFTSSSFVASEWEQIGESVAHTSVVYSMDDVEALGIAEGGAHDNIHKALTSFFRLNPTGFCYLTIAPDTLDLTQGVEDLQKYASGDLRKFAFHYDNTTINETLVQSLQSAFANIESLQMPSQAIVCSNLNYGAYASLTDLKGIGANKNVSVLFGFENISGTPNSFRLFGATIGAWAKSKASESIGHVARYDLSSATELQEIGLIDENDAFTSYTAMAQSLANAIDDKGYIIPVKYTGKAGTYLNDTYTCTDATSDYSRLQNSFVIDKAVRSVRQRLLPFINAEVRFNDDGTLRVDNIGIYKNECSTALDELMRLEEISAYDVEIDPAQDVLATSTINVKIRIIPNGYTKFIDVNIGFTNSLN